MHDEFMESFKNLTNNLLIIANNPSLKTHFFRIEKTAENHEIIKKNSLLRSCLLYPCYASSVHADKLLKLINANVITASSLPRDAFIDEHGELSDLFLAVQKYNQTISFPKVKNDNVPELNASKILDIQEVEISEELQNNKPETHQEKRFFKKYNTLRYPGDRGINSSEGLSIFKSTQKERFLSLLGTLFNISAFQKYHYRKNNESDDQIYAKRTSPISLVEKPTSYWLGHATIFLSIPLKSQKGTVASFYVIADPVERDINSILYPRYTKFARPIEELPAPHIYLLSHNHFDHFNKETVKKIFVQRPIMIVPKGDGERFLKIAEEIGITDSTIIELDWWETRQIAFEKNGERYQLQITATPTRHWSGQGPLGGHESTFLGYVIQGTESGDIYFAGDTARLNEEHIQQLRDNFDIRWSFQPGGPDEVRSDMEHTHQASADGLSMHFKVMILKIYEPGMQKHVFLERAGQLKTIYMHTMTFKLGNVHLSDTKESLERLFNALAGGSSSNLKSYEEDVYDELYELSLKLEFAADQRLSVMELSHLFRETVIVPKIGSRLGLETSKKNQIENLYF